MGKLRTRKDIETAVIDKVTGRAIKIILDPPGYDVKVRVKQSKQTYSMGMQDLLDACRSARGGHFSLAPSKPKVETQKPSTRDAIKELLVEHKSLHLTQVGQKLRQRGLDISKAMTGEILSIMTEQKQVEHDNRMYYSLAKAG